MAFEELNCPLRKSVVYITSHRTDGKAHVLDCASPPPPNFPSHGAILTPVFSNGGGFPVDLKDDLDVKAHRDLVSSGGLRITSPQGSVSRFVDMAPMLVPNMHRTQSIDYGVVIEGEVIIELDDGSKTLVRQGDVVV